MEFRILDLFAGAGGFSLGFEMAGATIVGAIEVDLWAAETFKENHKDTLVIQEDITKLKDEEIISLFQKLKPNIILGGPPCQGFSICNKNNGDPKDPRNSLFEEFIRFGYLIRPEIMIMENVPNLIKAKTKSNQLVIEIIKEELEQLGYFVNYKILEATDYGVPQIRKRLIVIATKKYIENPFPVKTHFIKNMENEFSTDNLIPCPTLWEAISDLPEINAREGGEILQHTKKIEHTYQEILRNKNETVIYNHKAMNHSQRLVERFSTMKWGDSSSDVPFDLRPRKRNSKEISSKIYDQNNRRMHPDRPCHTITASFYANFVHPYKNRNFTAPEGARIQSFSYRYIFKSKPTVVSKKLLGREGRDNELHLCQYNQIGNAVPPLLAKAIAQHLMNCYS